MSAVYSDRNLLFGVLALQMDFLDRDALIAALNAWILDKTKPLGDILVEQHTLRADERDVLDALVQKRLDRHHGDVEKSLAAVAVPTPLRADLHNLADPDVQASVAHLPATSESDQPAAVYRKSWHIRTREFPDCVDEVRDGAVYRKSWNIRSRGWIGRHTTLVITGVGVLLIALISAAVGTVFISYARHKVKVHTHRHHSVRIALAGTNQIR